MPDSGEPDIERKRLLLLECLRAFDDQGAAAQLDAFSEEDWENIRESAGRHGLYGLLYYRLKTLGFSDLPPPGIVQKFHNSFLLSARRNLLIFEDLRQVLTALNGAHIPVIPLKGAHLAALVYEDPALRQMGDLDLLVQRDALTNASEVLHGIGYQAFRAFDIDDECSRMQHLPPMSKETGSTSIEIHWTIVKPGAPFSIDINSFWNRSRRERIAGVTAYTLSPEDLLVHLSLHVSYQHYYRLGLSPLYDIRTVMQRFAGEIDWQCLHGRCLEWGIDKSLFLTLSAVDALLGTSPGQHTLSSMQPPDFQPWMLDAVIAQVISGGPELTINLAELMDDAGAVEKTRRLLGRIFPPPDVMRREYNLDGGAYTLASSYLKRLGTISRTNASTAWRLLKRDPQMLEQSNQQNDVVEVREWLGHN